MTAEPWTAEPWTSEPWTAVLHDISLALPHVLRMYVSYGSVSLEMKPTMNEFNIMLEYTCYST